MSSSLAVATSKAETDEATPLEATAEPTKVDAAAETAEEIEGNGEWEEEEDFPHDSSSARTLCMSADEIETVNADFEGTFLRGERNAFLDDHYFLSVANRRKPFSAPVPASTPSLVSSIDEAEKKAESAFLRQFGALGGHSGSLGRIASVSATAQRMRLELRDENNTLMRSFCAKSTDSESTMDIRFESDAKLEDCFDAVREITDAVLLSGELSCRGKKQMAEKLHRAMTERASMTLRHLFSSSAAFVQQISSRRKGLILYARILGCACFVAPDICRHVLLHVCHDALTCDDVIAEAEAEGDPSSSGMVEFFLQNLRQGTKVAYFPLFLEFVDFLVGMFSQTDGFKRFVRSWFGIRLASVVLEDGRERARQFGQATSQWIKSTGRIYPAISSQVFAWADSQLRAGSSASAAQRAHVWGFLTALCAASPRKWRAEFQKRVSLLVESSKRIFPEDEVSIQTFLDTPGV